MEMIRKRALTMAAALVAVLLTVGVAVAAVGPSPAAVGSSSTSSSTSTTVTTTAPVADGTTTYEVLDAGSVTVTAAGGTLQIDDVAPVSGWASEIEAAAGLEVEVKFVNGNRRVDFEAEIEDGQIKTRVRERLLDRNGGDDGDGATTTSTTMADDDGGAVADGETIAIDASPAGMVWVAVDGNELDLVDLAVNDGWTSTTFTEHDKVKVKFRNGSLEVEVEVEWEDGSLDIEVTMEDESASHDDNDSDDDLDDSNLGSDSDDDDHDNDDHDDDDDGDDDSDGDDDDDGSDDD
jgi:hypothetical protein